MAADAEPGHTTETAYMFKSAKLPLLLAFHAESGPDYKIVFKQGDDVRQDQLVINIIQLMDRLLKKEKLDLQLTSYKVLATGSSQGSAQVTHETHRHLHGRGRRRTLVTSLLVTRVGGARARHRGSGMIEFVQAEPLAKILEENNNDLQAFLRKHNRDDSAEYQIAPAVMDTYIKSCGTMRGVEADPPPPAQEKHGEGNADASVPRKPWTGALEFQGADTGLRTLCGCGRVRFHAPFP